MDLTNTDFGIVIAAGIRVWLVLTMVWLTGIIILTSKWKQLNKLQVLIWAAVILITSPPTIVIWGPWVYPVLVYMSGHR